MIKASLQEMMPAYLKLFNSVLTSGTMPNTWCRGLITPIYKSGARNEPSSYAGEESVSPAACFVDFKKAFDSVWHDELLFKLLKINVDGCFFNLIKSLYSNSTCSIKIGQNQRGPFPSVRGVRQGCIS